MSAFDTRLAIVLPEICKLPNTLLPETDKSLLRFKSLLTCTADPVWALIESICMLLLPVIVIVSAVACVVMLLPPAIVKVSPRCTPVAAESSPLKVIGLLTPDVAWST